MHYLFSLVLKSKDLSKAGDLFTLPDSSIINDISEILERIKEISSTSTYITNENDQSVVEICIARITATLRDNDSIETHIEALVDLLKTCLNHDLKPTCISPTASSSSTTSSSNGNPTDPPHAKIASDVLACIFLNYTKKPVMKQALPVAVKFLHKGNKELSRSVSSYLPLAAIEHPNLLSTHVQPIIDSLIAGNYTLARLLPQIYAINPERINEHIMALANLLTLCDDTEKSSLLSLFKLVATSTSRRQHSKGNSPSSSASSISQILQPSLPQLLYCLNSPATIIPTLEVLLEMCNNDNIANDNETSRDVKRDGLSLSSSNPSSPGNHGNTNLLENHINKIHESVIKHHQDALTSSSSSLATGNGGGATITASKIYRNIIQTLLVKHNHYSNNLNETKTIPPQIGSILNKLTQLLQITANDQSSQLQILREILTLAHHSPWIITNELMVVITKSLNLSSSPHSNHGHSSFSSSSAGVSMTMNLGSSLGSGGSSSKNDVMRNAALTKLWDICDDGQGQQQRTGTPGSGTSLSSPMMKLSLAASTSNGLSTSASAAITSSSVGGAGISTSSTSATNAGAGHPPSGNKNYYSTIFTDKLFSPVGNAKLQNSNGNTININPSSSSSSCLLQNYSSQIGSIPSFSTYIPQQQQQNNHYHGNNGNVTKVTTNYLQQPQPSSQDYIYNHRVNNHGNSSNNTTKRGAATLGGGINIVTIPSYQNRSASSITTALLRDDYYYARNSNNSMAPSGTTTGSSLINNNITNNDQLSSWIRCNNPSTAASAISGTKLHHPQLQGGHQSYYNLNLSKGGGGSGTFSSSAASILSNHGNSNNNNSHSNSNFVSRLSTNQLGIPVGGGSTSGGISGGGALHNNISYSIYLSNNNYNITSNSGVLTGKTGSSNGGGSSNGLVIGVGGLGRDGGSKHHHHQQLHNHNHTHSHHSNNNRNLINIGGSGGNDNNAVGASSSVIIMSQPDLRGGNSGSLGISPTNESLFGGGGGRDHSLTSSQPPAPSSSPPQNQQGMMMGMGTLMSVPPSNNNDSIGENNISVFEPFPMRDVVQHFCEKHLEKIKSYMENVIVRVPLPVKCTIEERKNRKSAKLHFSCQFQSENCVYSNCSKLFSMKTKYPRVWIHLMFLALQARSSKGVALSSRETSVSSLKNCWEILKWENKSFLTIVTSAFPGGKDQDNLVGELRGAGYFDLFEFNGVRACWGCLLCNHPGKALKFLNGNGNDEETVILEGCLKEKIVKWRLFKRWRTRYFTLSGGQLMAKRGDSVSTLNLQQITSVRVSRSCGTGGIGIGLGSGGINLSGGSKKKREIPKAFEIFTSNDKKVVLKPVKDGKNANEWVQCLSVLVARQDCQNGGNSSNSGAGGGSYGTGNNGSGEFGGGGITFGGGGSYGKTSRNKQREWDSLGSGGGGEEVPSKFLQQYNHNGSNSANNHYGINNGFRTEV